MKPITHYHTIATKVEQVLFKEKGSKFLGYLFSVTSEDAVKACLEVVKKQHHDARHWCYAYRLGYDGLEYRVNDDGEPSNTAGQPIYGQLLAYDVTNVLLIVVRYFGGVKLGVGGLIKAYRTCASLTLQEATVVSKTVQKSLEVTCSYQDMNRVMQIVKKHSLEIKKQEMHLNCVFVLKIPLEIFYEVVAVFEKLKGMQIQLKH